jgi:dTDP-4-amino-4,6-dideoxygalactose transaminase
MQPIYRSNAFVTAKGNGRGQSNAYIDMGKALDVGADIFSRGLCLPSDIKMTPEEQDMVIAVIRECFE